MEIVKFILKHLKMFLTSSTLLSSDFAYLLLGSRLRVLWKSFLASSYFFNAILAVARLEYAFTYIGSRDMAVLQSTSAAAYLEQGKKIQ